MSSFAAEGFYSSEARRISRDIRQRSREWFDFAIDLNKCLQKVMDHAGKFTDSIFSRRVIATAVFLRSADTFQGCLLLAERGMHISAYTLVRSLLEDSLCMSATYENWEKFKPILEEDYRAGRKRQMMNVLKGHAITDDEVSKLNDEVMKMGKSQTMDMRNISRLGPIEKQYLFYQMISSNAAHCSLDSLRSHIELAEEVSGRSGFKRGPSSKTAIDAVLWNACSAVIPTALAYCEIVENKEFQTMVSNYARLFQDIPSKQMEMVKTFRGNS